MERRPGEAPKLEPDALIEHLVPDASQVPDVRVLVGFLGKSTRERRWRLYLTPSLNEYVEFDEDDVVYSHTLESDESPLGGTVVWVRREANLLHTRSVSREAQADFLQGAITAGVSRRRGRFGPARQLLAFQQYVQLASLAVHVSCVREFCEFVVVSGEGFSFCCLPTWEAEC
ncbi:MAG TPA: hypothetical protein DEP84_10660 [Chloroflexi bacterium]|nr:hypothetical protein [Chloroflexota bacterium]